MVIKNSVMTEENKAQRGKVVWSAYKLGTCDLTKVALTSQVIPLSTIYIAFYILYVGSENHKRLHVIVLKNSWAVESRLEFSWLY